MKNSIKRRILTVILGILLLVGMIPVYGVESGDASDSIDCIIKTAEEIAEGGNDEIGDGYGKVVPGNVVNKGLVNGMARFGVEAQSEGKTSTSGDRLIIKVDNVALKDYPYVVIVYNTNINTAKINLNMTTVDGTYTTNETKLFAPQNRTVGELASATYSWDGKYGDSVKATCVFVPIYSTERPVMSDDDYMDIQYVGFFKNADDAEAFDYEDYIANLTHKIAFFDKDGEEIFSSEYGHTESIELPTAPEVDGYTFVGWSDGESEELITDNFVAITDVTLTAVYEEIKYTVTFLDEDGNEISSLEYTQNSIVELPDAPEIDGYMFVGWSDGESEELITDNFAAITDVTLTAVYEEIKYTVAFLDEDGNEISSAEYGHNSTVELPDAPEVNGYTFIGWSTGVDGEDLVKEDFVVITDVTLIAVYEKSTLYGDVNGDETVDRKDLTRLAQYFARWTVEIDNVASDANGDGTVDRKDLTRLAQYFARWSVTLGK